MLKSLLISIFGDEAAADKYIVDLVNPDGTISVIKRFGDLIGMIIGPVKRVVVEGVTRIVNIFA